MKSGESKTGENEGEGGDDIVSDKKTPTHLELNLREFNLGRDFSQQSD